MSLNSNSNSYFVAEQSFWNDSVFSTKNDPVKYQSCSPCDNLTSKEKRKFT